MSHVENKILKMHNTSMCPVYIYEHARAAEINLKILRAKDMYPERFYHVVGTNILVNAGTSAARR